MRDGVRIACFGSKEDSMLMWSHYADGLRGFCIVFDEKEVLMSESEAYVLNVEYQDTPPIVDSFVYAIARDQDWYNQNAIEETQARIRYSGNTDDDQWISIYEKHGAMAVTQMREIWKKVFAVKPLEWKYEDEKRLLIHTDQYDNKPVLHKYQPQAVKEIILGERMHDDYRNRIISLMQKKYPYVVIRTARRAQDIYSIVVE